MLRLRVRLERLLKLMDLDAPKPILGNELYGILMVAFSLFGEDLWRAIGVCVLKVSKIHAGICPQCDDVLMPIQSHILFTVCKKCEVLNEQEIKRIENGN